jgi:GR25 family glycosyltransferase involved in LPS biosynthesis
MLHNTAIHHIFIIGNPKTEPQRIQYLQEYFSSHELDSHVSYFQPTYKDSLSAQELETYIPENFSKIHNRPLTNAEISIFLNFIYLFEKILAEYSSGYFAIFESDVIFEGDLRDYFLYLTEFLHTVSPDAVSIGSGCDCIHDNVNTDDLNIQIFPETTVRCMDSFIFSYNGIQKFLRYFYKFLETEKSINEPIDNFFQTYLNLFDKDEDFKQFWVWPSITLQGSQNGQYSSSIQSNIL